ncbi:MAG: hypothetical protein JXB04_00895, partial [Kiritimatiellae bacterium]|nr:hypothetical protein [Kiritimatiellia bacterium]
MDSSTQPSAGARATARHWVEYLALRALGVFLCLLPYRLALLFGWTLARAAYALGSRRIQTVRQRIREALGVGDREAARIAWLAWRDLCFNGIDILRSPYVTKRWVRRVTDYTEIEKLLAPRRAGRNVILAIPHMGSWEVAGLSASLFDVPLLYITRRQKNPLFYRYLNRVRSRTGQKCVDRDDPRLIR